MMQTQCFGDGFDVQTFTKSTVGYTNAHLARREFATLTGAWIDDDNYKAMESSMTIPKNLVCLTAVSLAMLASTQVHADANPNRGLRFGIETGLARHGVDENAVNRNYQVEDPNATEVSSYQFGYAFYAGYRFSKYLAIDGGIVDLGAPQVKIGFHSGTDCVAGVCTPVRRPPMELEQNRVRGARFRANGSWPLNATWSAEGRLGLILIGGGDSVGGGFQAGVGASARLLPALRVGLFWDRLSTTNQDEGPVHSLSLTLGYQF